MHDVHDPGPLAQQPQAAEAQEDRERCGEDALRDRKAAALGVRGKQVRLAPSTISPLSDWLT
jgi:hypothetical protein